MTLQAGQRSQTHQCFVGRGGQLKLLISRDFVTLYCVQELQSVLTNVETIAEVDVHRPATQSVI